jgi:hypothetical protein
LFDQRQWSRPRSLLAQYLQRHPLTSDDYLALSRFWLRHRFPPEPIARSYTLGWQQVSPDDPRPSQLAARMLSSAPAARSAALQGQLAGWESIAQSRRTDRSALRWLAQTRMDVYRSQRSAFYHPPTAPIESLLEELVRRDGERRHLYELFLAELAWDRGDDRLCLTLAEQAFERQQQVPVRFAAPVVTRMLESLIRVGDMQRAKFVCQVAMDGGLAGRDSRPRDDVLEMTVRKVLHATPRGDGPSRQAMRVDSQ